MTKKYRVMVEGQNFLLRVDNETGKYGFFTVRFVEARDGEEAENKVMEILRHDLRTMVQNEKSDSPMMYVEEIEELRSFDGFAVPGSGCSWYPED